MSNKQRFHANENRFFRLLLQQRDNPEGVLRRKLLPHLFYYLPSIVRNKAKPIRRRQKLLPNDNIMRTYTLSKFSLLNTLSIEHEMSHNRLAVSFLSLSAVSFRLTASPPSMYINMNEPFACTVTTTMEEQQQHPGHK